jgi:RNA polymerase sigma factor for flagellar operon FliA
MLLENNYELKNIKREEMILEHLPLVHKISKGIKLNSNMSVTKDDLYSAGVIGLMEAVDKYDEDKNVVFAAFATLRIKGAMIDEIRKQSNLSRGKVKKLSEYNNAVDELRNKLSREPEDKEVAKILDIDLETVFKIKDSAQNIGIYYLDQNSTMDGDNESCLKDLLIDKKLKSPEEELMNSENIKFLMLALDKLTERERIILNLIYTEELSLKEIAYVIEVSISRISQIHSKALKKLEEYLR